MISRNSRKKLTQRGFTIIELLIATTVFSVVLLLCSFSLLQIGKTYYKGLTSSRTQSAARAALDDIAQAIQFSAGNIYAIKTGTGGTSYFCVSDKRYTFVPGQQLTSSPSSHALVRDNPGTCSDPGGWPTSDANELLGVHMRLVRLEICQPGELGQYDVPPSTTCHHHTPINSNLYSINIRVVYGDDDLLTDSDGDGILDSCKAGAGSQFCAVSDLTTAVQKRVL